MTRKRAHISLTTKLAATLAELQFLRGDPIPFDQLKLMTAAQYVSLYEWDHAALYIWTQNDHFTNLTPRLILAHRAKTKKDRKLITKIRKAEKRKRGEKKPKTKWPSRPFPGSRADKEARAK